MSVQLDSVASTQKDLNDKTKIQLMQLQNEVDIREMEINRIKKITEDRDREIEHLSTLKNMQEATLKDIEEELEMKSGENNRLRKQCCDLEKAMQDLYCSRKGNGSLQIELDSLKQDNEQLLALLKETSEYGDMDDDQIQKHAIKATMKPVGGSSVSGKSKRTVSTANETVQGGPSSKKDAKNNDWIPTQAVRAILQIKEKFNGSMSETCVSQILYDLNTIWREIMRKENNAIKKRLTAQI